MPEINPTNINGVDYYTVQQFATIWGKGVSQIYILIRKEIIKHERLMNQMMVPANQLDKRDRLFPDNKTHYGSVD